MAVYNGGRFLEAQVRSILDQTYRAIELIIADDGSTDSSLAIIRRMAAKDDRIRLYQNNRNLGIAANFLNALRYAEGELTGFADQDDVWDLRKIESLKGLVEKDSATMLVYSDLEICDEGLRRITPSFWKSSGICPRRGSPWELILFRNLAPGCSMLFRSEVKETLIRLSNKTSLMHDHLAMLTAALLGRIDYVPLPLVKYRQHAANQIGAFSNYLLDRVPSWQQMREEVTFLMTVFPVDWSGVERFLDRDPQANFFLRIEFLKYFLYLRRDCLHDKCLGVFECLAPTLYRFFRERNRA